MEGLETYKSSYDYLTNVCKQNMTDQVIINYNKMDLESEKQLRELIHNFTIRRKREIFSVIQKCQPDNM